MNNKTILIGAFGPKGGVGKTALAANTALGLAEAGLHTVAVDLDLGAANLHSLFGVSNVNLTLDDFFNNKCNDLQSIVKDVGVQGLGILCGGDQPGVANLAYQKKVKLMRHLAKLLCDAVVMDMSAGAASNPADFLIACDAPLLIATPDVQSLSNLYSFIKTTVHRRLTFLFRRTKRDALLKLLLDSLDKGRHPHLQTIDRFFSEAWDIDAEGAEEAMQLHQRLAPYIVLNRIRNASDLNVGSTVRSLLSDKLGVTCKRIVTIREDKSVGRSELEGRPVMLAEPTSPFAEDIRLMIRAVLGKHRSETRTVAPLSQPIARPAVFAEDMPQYCRV